MCTWNVPERAGQPKSMTMTARCDLRFGLRSFSGASGIQCGTMFSKLWSVAPRQVGDRVGHTLRGMQTAELLDRAAEREEVIYNRGVQVPLRESLVTEEDIAAADDILDADR